MGNLSTFSLLIILIGTQYTLLVSSTSTIQYEDQCKGKFDRSLYASLDRVCEDCFSQFKGSEDSFELADKCRNSCFTSDYFKACVEELSLEKNEIERLQNAIKTIHGAAPEV